MDRKGDFFVTIEGKKFYVLDPRPEDIDINDIATALSKKCRWGGHCSGFFSVAEHSVLCSYLVPRGMELSALLHDASEAYLPDLPSPIKDMPEFAIFSEAEDLIHEAVALKFNLHYLGSPEVKAADMRSRQVERDQLIPFPRSLKNFANVEDLEGLVLRCLSCDEAATQFMARYNELKYPGRASGLDYYGRFFVSFQ
jgi:hypothetical protein